MLKLLLLGGILYLSYILFFKKSKFLNTDTTTSNTSEPTDATDEMIECAHCSTFVSLDESILSQGKHYCSQECIKAVS